MTATYAFQDQAERCLDLGIDTVTWNSGTTEAQRTNIEKELRSGEPSIKLLYTTPESLRAPRLAAALQVESQSKVELYTDVKCEHKSSKYGYDICCQNNSNLDEHF